jgi:hypothetical protein
LVKFLFCLTSTLFLSLLAPCFPAFSQALQDRTDPEQLALARSAVLDGRLPPYDTWPQPALPTPEAAVDAVTWGSRFEGILGGAARLNGQDFWDQYLFEPGDQNAFAKWTLHGESKGNWGFLLHSDFYDRTPGWHATTLLWPTATSAVPLESHFLTKSLLWYNFHPLQIEVGRDKVHVGPMDHSLILSDAVPFLDMIRGTISGGPWTLDWLVATPETRTEGGGTDVQTTVLLNSHRLEYRADTWSWAASENYIVHRSASGPFVLADVFPVGITHQLDINPNNNCLIFDGQWVPASGLRLMGQFGFDDIDGRTLGLPDNPVPTIWAFLFGTEWQGDADGPLRLYAEVGMTHYLWGNFGDPAARADYLIVQDERTESMPLTSPYGPGTAWVNFSTRWSHGPLSLEGKLEIFDTKEGVTLDVPYVYNWGLEGFGSSPSERFSCKVRWQWSRDLGVTLEPIQRYHTGTVGLEARATVDWTP